MDIRLPPITKTVGVLFLVAVAAGTAKSRDPLNPDLAFVGSLAKQGVEVSVGAAQEARKLVTGTDAATAQQPAPQELQPRSSAADAASQPIVPEPSQPAPPTLGQLLGCDGPTAESVIALNQQSLTAWLTRAGGFPRASLAALHEPRPGLPTPAACVSSDRTRAVWLLTFGGNRYHKLVAHFDSNQLFLRYDPPQPVAIP